MASVVAQTQPLPAPAPLLDIDGYVAQAKAQLDAFAAQWRRQRLLAPSIYPSHQTDDQWRRQELAARFGQLVERP